MSPEAAIEAAEKQDTSTQSVPFFTYPAAQVLQVKFASIFRPVAQMHFPACTVESVGQVLQVSLSASSSMSALGHSVHSGTFEAFRMQVLQPEEQNVTFLAEDSIAADLIGRSTIEVPGYIASYTPAL